MKAKTPIVAIQLFSTPESSDDSFKVISADAVIVRADYLGTNDKINQISLATGVKIFSLRSVNSGGRFQSTARHRCSHLIQALEHYDLVELEAETDLTSEILRLIPADRRIISWYGEVNSYKELENKYYSIKQIDAKFHQVILTPKTISEGLWSLKLLKNQNDEKLISYSCNAIGVWTQLISVFLGSNMVSGVLENNKGVEAFLTYDQLKNEYNLPSIRNVKQVFGIAGNPVFSSLSPLIHNRCYESLGMEVLYLPFHIEDFDDFWQFITIDFPASELNLNLGGFTMVSPFKEATFNSAEKHLSKPTLNSKACNILINKNGRWYSDSSDGLGVLAELKERNLDFEALKIAIIGCGGAGRTIASRLKGEGAEIVMYNRSTERGNYAAKLLDLPFRPISEFDASIYDVVVNATPVGKLGKNQIFNPSGLRQGSLAIDMAYSRDDTLLVRGCRQHGKNIIEGKQILLHQVKKQFSGLTGMEMPSEVELIVREKTANLQKMN